MRSKRKPCARPPNACELLYYCGVDEISAFLEGPRARNAFLLKSCFDPPWSLAIQDQAPLTVVVMLRGGCWVRHCDTEPVRIGEGDTALIVGPDPYVMSDAVDTTPQIVIHPGQVCATLEGREVAYDLALGVRAWGSGSTQSESVCVTGVYTGVGELSRRLLSVLPRVALLPGKDFESAFLAHLVAAMGHDLPGQSTVLDRLLDLVLIDALRTWFEGSTSGAPGWFRAGADPVVGPALRAMQSEYRTPWTVEALAALVGVSRSLLARRFTQVVGSSPMAYLTDWRLAMAADLLSDDEVTVHTIATRVGYASPFTFSTAFKRHYGMSPSQFRLRATSTNATTREAI